MQLEQMNLEQLQTEEKNLLSTHQQFLDSSLKLDLTRGKPSAEQLSLSEGMVGLLAGKMIHEDGTDLRNSFIYGAPCFCCLGLYVSIKITTKRIYLCRNSLAPKT